MAICNSGEKLLQEATGIRRGRVYRSLKTRMKNCVSAESVGSKQGISVLQTYHAPKD